MAQKGGGWNVTCTYTGHEDFEGTTVCSHCESPAQGDLEVQGRGMA